MVYGWILGSWSLKPVLFWGHCDLDLLGLNFLNNLVWSIIYIIWGRNPKFMLIHLGVMISVQEKS